MSKWLSPEGLRFTPDHAWIRLEGEEAVVGVTDYFQETAGDILYVQLPQEGATLTPGEPACSLEAGKWVGHILAPLAGTVVAVNRALESRPGLINTDPYGDGWLFRLTVSGRVPEDLLDANGYRTLLRGLEAEEVRA